MTYQYPRRMGDCMDFRCAFAAAVNYVCTAVNFSFARMRKKYIEDNDELDAEKVEKVAPYYQKTSVVLAGTQIGYLFCSSIFALSLYQSVRHMVLFWEETNFFSAVLVYVGVSAYIVIALMLYWILPFLCRDPYHWSGRCPCYPLIHGSSICPAGYGSLSFSSACSR